MNETQDVVYKTLNIRRLTELFTVIKMLTESRREWSCKTSGAGWTVSYETFDDDKLFSELKK